MLSYHLLQILCHGWKKGNIKIVRAISYSATDTNGDDEDPSINQEESGSENLDFSTNNDARF